MSPYGTGSTSVLLLSVIRTLPWQAGAQELTVRVDSRFELVSTIFHLTGNPDYNMGKPSAYDSAFTAHFDAHREHAAVKMARTLSRAHGLYRCGNRGDSVPTLNVPNTRCPA